MRHLNCETCGLTPHFKGASHRRADGKIYLQEWYCTVCRHKEFEPG